MISSISDAATGRMGVGLAFNPALAGFVAAHSSALDFLEVSPERFWHDRGPGAGAGRYMEISEAVAQLEATRGDLPLLAHGVGLSIATAGPLDMAHVEQMARWHERYGFAWFSEHLAYFRLGPDADWRGIGVMLPPIYDEAALHDLTAKVRQVSDMLGIEILLENTVNYTPVPDAEFSEAAFLRLLAMQTDAGLLLDLHNLHTNALNHGWDALEVIDGLDLALVQELHIAGGEDMGGIWLDSHAGRCAPQVWTLLEHTLSRPNGIRAITFEVDESHAARMEAGVLLDELAHARACWNAARGGTSRDVQL